MPQGTLQRSFSLGGERSNLRFQRGRGSADLQKSGCVSLIPPSPLCVGEVWGVGIRVVWGQRSLAKWGDLGGLGWGSEGTASEGVLEVWARGVLESGKGG